MTRFATNILRESLRPLRLPAETEVQAELFFTAKNAKKCAQRYTEKNQ
jgi:hypothetical protein